MNFSNVTEPYHYYDYDTQPTDDLVTFNFSVTPTATLTPVTFDSGDVPDNLGALSTATQVTLMSPLVGGSDGGGWSLAVPLWLPYVIFTVVLLSLIVVSFARFHALRGAQYRNRQMADERATGLNGPKNGYVPRGDATNPNGLFSGRPSSNATSSSVMPHPPDYLALFLEFSRDDARFDNGPPTAGGWNPPRRVPSRTRSDDLTTVGRSERRTSRSSQLRSAVQRSAAGRGPSQRPLMYAYNDNGSMVDVRCEPAEWTTVTMSLCNEALELS